MFCFSGDVVTMECVNELIRKDMVCPISGIKLKESDIIPLVRVSLQLFAYFNVNLYLFLNRELVDMQGQVLNLKQKKKVLCL